MHVEKYFHQKGFLKFVNFNLLNHVATQTHLNINQELAKIIFVNGFSIISFFGNQPTN